MMKNYLTAENADIPNYALNSKEMYFDIYISYDRKVYIEYRYDANYTGAVYFTSLDNYDEMKEIFNYCLHNRPSLAAGQVRLEKDKENEYHELLKGFRVYVQKEYYANAKKEAGGSVGEMRYHVQGSNSFMGDENTDGGDYIVRSLCEIYAESQAKIKVLLMNSQYYAMLKHYYSILAQPHDDYHYYDTCKPIGDVLKEQTYMHLCPDDDIRCLFIKAEEAMGKLYQEKMRAIR